MSILSIAKRLLGAVSSLAISRLAVPPFAPAAEDPAVADQANSLLGLNLSERVLKYDSNNEDPEGLNPTVEDAATVEYELFDGDVKVGQMKGVGRMLYKRDHGAFVAYFSEVITLTDGTVIRIGGLVDDSRLTAGE